MLCIRFRHFTIGRHGTWNSDLLVDIRIFTFFAKKFHFINKCSIFDLDVAKVKIAAPITTHEKGEGGKAKNKKKSKHIDVSYAD